MKSIVNYKKLMKEMEHDDVSNINARLFLMALKNHQDSYTDSNELEIIHIYRLLNPITNDIFYVGRTNKPLKNRLADHLSSFVNIRKMKEIKSILKRKQVPVIELIEDVTPTEKEEYKGCHERERYWIKEYKKQGFALTNR